MKQPTLFDYLLLIFLALINTFIYKNNDITISKTNRVMEHTTKQINALRNELHWKYDHVLKKTCKELKGTEPLLR